MTYVDLGQYTFTTGADYTGFNVGNLTSILDPAAIRIPNYELYRLLINTSAVPGPGQVPAIVQSAMSAPGASLTALDLTFPQPVTLGNQLSVGVITAASGNIPTPTAMTIGGSADSFFSLAAAGTSAGANEAVASLWVDNPVGEASAALAITLAGGSGTAYSQAFAYEISRLAGLDPGGSLLVDTGGGVALGTTTPNGATTGPNDMQIGFGVASAGASLSVIQPGGWMTMNGAVTKLGTSYLAPAASWNLASATGSPTAYSLQASQAAYWSALSQSFTAQAAGAAIAFPFTIATDGVNWDSEQTTPGTGYTYSLGQSPLYLKTGQTLQIFWQLDAPTYASYSQLFNITGWFRYDPSVQP